MKVILKDRLLIDKIEVKTTSSILDVVEDENSPKTGKVILKGKLVEDIEVGDIVKYKENDALPITVENKNMYILREYDIIGII